MLNPKTISYGILRALGILAAIFLLLYFLYEIQSVIAYIAIAAVISLIGRPVVIFLRTSLRFPNHLAVILVLIMVIAFFIGIVAMFVPIIVKQSQNLAEIDMRAFESDLQALNAEISGYFGAKQINVIEGIRNTEYVRNFDLGRIPLYLNKFFGYLGAALIAVFSILFISFFLLKDTNLMLSSVLVFANKGEEQKFKRVFDTIKILLSRYFVGLTLQVFILFVFYSILLSAFDVDNPIAIAFICAFLNLIPYLGPLVAGFLMAMFVISSNLGADFSTVILPVLIKVMSGYILAQVFDNFVSQPVIFGASVRSHPLEIFLIILISGLLFGILGMVVAIPVYTAIKVIAKESFNEYKIVKKLTKNL